MERTSLGTMGSRSAATASGDDVRRGNKHYDDSIRIIHAALDAGINLSRHGRRLLG
jgi:hypothetical protein